MKRLYIASMGLAATVLLAAASIVTATYGHGLTADPTAHPKSVCGLYNPGHQASQPGTPKEAEAKASPSAVRLTAQVPIATVCYTFAGPTCPMFNLVPAGSLCECPSPFGPLEGIAY